MLLIDETEQRREIELRTLVAYGDRKAVVPLTLSQSTLERINQLAIARGINRSALIRAAIAAVYFADDRSTDQPSERPYCVATPTILGTPSVSPSPEGDKE
jgi:hypothetical protein